MKRALQGFLSYFREKHSDLLDGPPYLIAYQFMTKNLDSPFRLLGPCYQSFRKGMQKRLLHI